MSPPFHHADFESRACGVDATDGRFGDVSIERCTSCGRYWLTYLHENEAVSLSGRWFRALVTEEEALAVKPEEAIDMIQRAELRFAGGSYYASAGFRHTGRVYVG
jgi:hypothetical protein